MKRFVGFVCIFISLFLTGCRESVILTDINDYDKYIELMEEIRPTLSQNFMPSLDEFDNAESIEVVYYFNDPEWQGSRTVALTIQYLETEYAIEKEDALNKYIFLIEPVKLDKKFKIPIVEFDYKDYTIKVASEEKFDYPGYFGMLAYSDTEFKICYMFFTHPSLDYIADKDDDKLERMQRFIDDYFIF